MLYKTSINGYVISKVLKFRCNAFVLSNGKQHLLIDCGSKHFRRQLLWGLAKRGIRHLDALILTHTHFDHCGNSHYIKNRFNTRIIVHQSEAGYLATGKSPIPKGSVALTKWVIGFLEDRVPKWACYQPTDPDIMTDDIYRLDDFGFNAYLLHTPGHSAGSMSLIIDDEIAITGDAMFGILPGSVFPPFADDVPTMIQSWKKLLDSGVVLFLPSHGLKRSKAILQTQYEKYNRKDPL